MKTDYENCIEIIDNVLHKIDTGETLEEIKKYLETKKSELKNSTDQASKYMDKLIKDLK